MDIFNNLINIIKNKYPNYSKFLEVYFIKYKEKFFINCEYNYNKLPKNYRSIN